MFMKKKILIFHPIIAPYRVDFFNALARHFNAKIVLLWRNLKDQNFNYQHIEEQFTFIPQYCIKEEMGTLNWLCNLWKLLSKERPALVIVSEYGICTLLTILHRIITFSKYKIVTISDDSYNILTENNHFTKRHQRAIKYFVPFIDNIINVEPRAEKWYKTKYHKGIYFPIICDDIIARERLKRVLPISEQYITNYKLEGKKVLLFVGRLVALKNIEFAIKAFIKANIPDTVFVIVGNGELENSLKTLSSKYDNILIVGRYEGDELYAWYNVANIFTLQSTQESFGAVTNEALIAGCKVLVSKNAGSNCLVKNGENGYIINPKDNRDYIGRLKQLLMSTTPITLPLSVKSNQMQESFSVCTNRLITKINTLLQ